MQEVTLNRDDHGMQRPHMFFLRVIPRLLHASVVFDSPVECLMTAARAYLKFVNLWLVKVVWTQHECFVRPTGLVSTVGNNHFSYLYFVLQPFLKDSHVMRPCRERPVDPDAAPSLYGYAKLVTKAGVFEFVRVV